MPQSAEASHTGGVSFLALQSSPRPPRWTLIGLVAQLAVSGQILTLTDAQEVEVGKKIAALVEFEQPLFEDRPTGDYFQKVGLRLARESERGRLRYAFKLLQSDDVNAFALPGGFIYLTRAFVEAVHDEHELAAALAHEIAHVAAKQHAGKIRRSQLASLGVSFLGPALGGGVRAATAVRSARSGSRGFLMRFTREDEREADRIAAKMLFDAGYDPAATLRLLARLGSLDEENPGLVRRYFRSHAKVEERLENLRDILATLPKPPRLRPGVEEFRRIQRRIAEVKPKGTILSSEAAAALIEADEDAPASQAAKDREVAALYAPIFHQGLGDEPRFDYITNFDFDGDWRGDNNWDNAAESRFPLKAWVYYSVRETRTHYFIHYAVFHPRDYKGGSGKGRFFSRLIRTSTKPAAAVDPTGRAAEAVLAHENDLEGCLLVVEKRGEDPGEGKVIFVQTMAHNSFLKYVPQDSPRDGFEPFEIEGRRVRLFIEPKGHGILAWQAESKQAKTPVLLYTFTGQAETPDDDSSKPAGYDLTPISTTLWPAAKGGVTPTYAAVQDFGTILIDLIGPDGNPAEVTWGIGQIGTAFRGIAGGLNLARAPWGWFDSKDQKQPPGQWFFDPARVVRRDYGLDDSFATAYLRPWPGDAEEDEADSL